MCYICEIIFFITFFFKKNQLFFYINYNELKHLPGN